VREPPNVVSSCAAATAASSTRRRPLGDQPRRLEQRRNEPSRLSSARGGQPPFGSSTGARSITATSPMAPAWPPVCRRGRRCRCAGRGCSRPSCAPRRGEGGSASADDTRERAAGRVDHDPLAGRGSARPSRRPRGTRGSRRRRCGSRSARFSSMCPITSSRRAPLSLPCAGATSATAVPTRSLLTAARSRSRPRARQPPERSRSRRDARRQQVGRATAG